MTVSYTHLDVYKRQLMLQLNGILNGTGSIRVADVALAKNNLGRIRALVGLVFQNPDDQLFSPTVFDDVAFGPLHMGLPEAEVRSRVDQALQQVNMHSYIDPVSYTHLDVYKRQVLACASDSL